MKLLVAILPCVLIGCAADHRPQPPLLHGLPTDFKEGKAELERRARKSFPVGSSEQALVKRLIEQGFDIGTRTADEDGPWQDANFERKEIPCITYWSIRWRAKEQRVADIWALYGQQCP